MSVARGISGGYGGGSVALEHSRLDAGLDFGVDVDQGEGLAERLVCDLNFGEELAERPVCDLNVVGEGLAEGLAERPACDVVGEGLAERPVGD